MILLSKAIDVERDHLIHRKRSPFPYEGKDLMRRKVGETSSIVRNTSNSGERSIAALPDRGRMRTFAQPGGAKPIAARDTSAGRLVGRCRRGSAVSGTPPTELPVRTQAYDGQRASTRACAKRRAQVCDEITFLNIHEKRGCRKSDSPNLLILL